MVKTHHRGEPCRSSTAHCCSSKHRYSRSKMLVICSLEAMFKGKIYDNGMFYYDTHRSSHNEVVRNEGMTGFLSQYILDLASSEARTHQA
jgi:hypothetical protein